MTAWLACAFGGGFKSLGMFDGSRLRRLTTPAATVAGRTSIGGMGIVIVNAEVHFAPSAYGTANTVFEGDDGTRDGCSREVFSM